MTSEANALQSSTQAKTEKEATPNALVDSINAAFGRYPRARAVHAKGTVVHGSFSATPRAAELSVAPHLQGSPVPLTVRFSNFGPDPATSDVAEHGGPRGMAIRFHLSDGSEADMVTHSYNGFPTATAAEFRELMLAIAASRVAVGSPTPLETFFETHPAARPFLEAPNWPPVSYGTIQYFGVNAIRLTNPAGRSTVGRFRLQPRLGEQFLSAEQRRVPGPDYLQDELRERLARGPIEFSLTLQVAEPGDAVADPSIVWPESRTLVDLGRLTLDRVAADSATLEQALLFNPAALPSGIEAVDPMLQVRSKAYPESYDRRHR